MRFRAEHQFPAPPRAVADALVDPEVAMGIALPDLSPPELVVTERDARRGRLTLRYEYVGGLDPVARRVLGARRLTWSQTLELDFTALRGSLTFAADGAADKLYARATVALVDRNDDDSVRRIEGEFVVRVPLVGSTAERRILPGVVRRLDVEAAAVAAHLR